MSNQTETLSGYVVDIICLRLYPQNELLERAKVHTRKCSLAGHCTESGFGLVDEEGTMSLLDPNATPQLLDVIRSSDRDSGIELQVTREMQDGDMKTIAVKEI
jgi:hypothetical protein